MIPVPALPPPPEPPAAVATVKAEPTVAAALTDAQIRVDARFSGASITLFGAVFNPTDTPTDVVVVVRGPDEPVRLARKTRVAGLWLNGRPVLFEGAPGFYMTASSKPLSDITGFGVLRRLGVGVDHLRIDAPEERTTATRYGVRDVVVSSLGEDYLDWRRAVIRLKEEADLYTSAPDGVSFIDQSGLFRARIDLPAEAPTGRYATEVWLFQNGEPVSSTELTMSVEKVGLERTIYDFAHRRPWSYGVLCVLMALATGWAASRIFRRA